MSGVQGDFHEGIASLRRGKDTNIMDSKDTCCIKLQNKPQKIQLRGFPGGSVVKNLPANAGEVGSIPGSGRHRGEEMATHSVFLPGNPIDRGT